VDITNSKLDNNIATTCGGAIYTHYTTLMVSNSELNDNHAGASGGTILHWHDIMKVTDCTLMDNTSGANAGGIFVEEDVAVLTGSKLIDNSGGGIYRSGLQGSLTVGTTLFQGNTPWNIWGFYTDQGGNTFM
jgi:predicted outer membrane repeat protein